MTSVSREVFVKEVDREGRQQETAEAGESSAVEAEDGHNAAL